MPNKEAHLAAQHSTPFSLNLRTVLLVTMVTLQLGDYLSTLRALRNGAVELGAIGYLASNPIALFVFKIICMVWFAALLYREKFPIEKRVRIGALLCAFYACVVAANLSV